MAAIAEWPDRIENIFSSKEYPADGMFSVNFYLAGRREKVTFDDRLPVMEWGSDYKPINLRKSPNDAWWGPILEKGAAKFFGRYENMDGGLESESLYHLTGMPTRTIKNSDLSESELWAILKDYDQRNYVMTTSVVDNGDGVDKKGLPTGHAYTLKGVHEYNGVKLVEIRNPWGAEKYMGEWSD